MNIAKKIRASSGGFPGVKALGVYLLSRKQSQVSMNLTDFRSTPVHVVFDAVREQAEAAGVRIVGSEIIGLIPKAAIEMAANHYIRCENFSPDLVLENRLAEALPYSTDDVLDQLSDPARAAGENAPALAGAMAAALGVLTSRLVKGDPQKFVDHRVFFKRASDRPALSHHTLENAEAAMSIAERAHALHEDLRLAAKECPQQCLSDVTTAMGLALSAKSGAIAAVVTNLPHIGGGSDKSALETRLETIK
jgi:hypothetical protein